MIQLPTKPLAAKSSNPKRLTIFARPKLGKSSLLAALEDNFIIDLESGYTNYSAMYHDVRAYAKDNGISMLDSYKELIASLEKQKRENNNVPVYKYITLDTLTVLEQISTQLALVLYKASPLGKSFAGDNIHTLANGASWYWVRMSMDKLLEPLENYCTDCVILVSHIKTASLNKNGQDITAVDMALSPGIKHQICSSSDSVGMLRREKNTTQNFITFQAIETNLATGSRNKHLENQEFIISELKDGKLETHWDKIFIKE
jgi:hypothetical protein